MTELTYIRFHSDHNLDTLLTLLVKYGLNIHDLSDLEANLLWKLNKNLSLLQDHREIKRLNKLQNIRQIKLGMSSLLCVGGYTKAMVNNSTSMLNCMVPITLAIMNGIYFINTLY